MRRFLSVLSLAALACLVACNDDDPYFHAPNEIVFGVSQSFAADGTAHLEGDYAFLGLANQASRFYPWVFNDADGTSACYYERFDPASEHAPSDPGTAIFTGGKLPAAGLSIAANQPGQTTLDGAGWASSDVLSFKASGFAMPSVDGAQLYAPSTALDITSISPSGDIHAADDVIVQWAPTGEDSRIMVALDTDVAPNGTSTEVRCFTGSSYGRVVIPHTWIQQLFANGGDLSAPVTGHLRVATHSQVTIAGPKNWLVYVVATSIHHDSTFTGLR